MTDEVTIRKECFKEKYTEKFWKFSKEIRIIPEILLYQAPIAIFQVQSESIHAE